MVEINQLDINERVEKKREVELLTHTSISAELMGDKMPYLGEDEHLTNPKSAAMATSNSNTSDAEDIPQNVENKVTTIERINQLLAEWTMESNQENVRVAVSEWSTSNAQM